MKTFLLLASSVLAGSIATAAVAQQTAAAETTEAGDEMLVVTGSRIVRPEIEYSAPVQSLTAANIEASGDINITEFLLDSPALVGSLGNQRNSGSNTFFGSVGIGLLDLRNLGTQRTLVLVNGRRHVNAYPGENSVDVNTIPVDLIDRVDILTGGVSAIYGADGVTGVVNFVMKRNFEGLRARMQAGISERGDAGNRFASVLFGKNFADGRGNVTVSYEYSKQDRFNERERDYLGDPSRNFQLLRDPADFPDSPTRFDRALFNNVSWADSAPNGAVDLDFDGVPDFEGSGRVYDGGQPLSGSGGRAINSTSNTPTAGYFGDLAPGLQRHNVNVLTSFEVSPAVRFFAEGKYVRSDAVSFGQPSFDFFTLLADDNAYVNQRFGEAAPFGALVTRDNFDLGVSQETAKRDTYRAVIGMDGTLSSGERSGNLRYEISYVYGRADATTINANSRVQDRYFAAIDAVVDPRNGQITCRINLPGQTTISGTNADLIADFGLPNYVGAPVSFRPGECVPLNILGEGVRSDAAQRFAMVNDVTRQNSEQHVLSGSLAGDLGFLFSLPGGPVAFAVGGEYRRESTKSTPGAFRQQGFYEGGAAILTSGGAFDVKEVFGEINVPLLAGVPLAERLSFGGAIRYSDYSTIGTTLTWQLNGTYAPIKDIAFRATYSSAVRAPNITELFSPPQGTFLFLDDPCDPTFLAEGTTFRAANCNAALAAAGLTPAQILAFSPATDAQQSTSQPGLTGGNPNLRAETAKTWTAGVVLRPRFIEGLSFTADWYDIKLQNAINTPDVNEVFKLCVDAPNLNNAFCNSFERAPGTGFLRNFVVSAQNVAAFTTSGLEVSLNYLLQPKWKHGTFNLRLVGGYLNDLTFLATIGGVPEQQRNRSFRPNYVGNMDLTWQNGPLSINYGLAWQGKTQRFTTIQLNAQPDLVDPRYFFRKERWEHDISASYQVANKFTLFGGVNNFTNQQPDLSSNIPVSAVGRYFFIGAKVNLDKLF
jgi:iron complex outermembrane recepter protein